MTLGGAALRTQLTLVQRSNLVEAAATEKKNSRDLLRPLIPIARLAALSDSNLFTCAATCVTARFSRIEEANAHLR